MLSHASQLPVTPYYLPSMISCLVLCLPAFSTAGEPYLPGDDAEVLETLPIEFFARRDGIVKLRERLSADPENDELAATVAQHYAGLGKSEGDPRFFGYARAAIGPWWDSDSASPAILSVRAKLKETDHHYREALADLKSLLDQQSDDVQAWVEVANINRVLGDYEAAQQACERLDKFELSTPAAVARIPLLAATGEAEQAYELLDQILPDARENLPAILPWVHTMRAEIARALGRAEQAAEHYAEGIELSPGNSYLKRAYADFLLDQERGDAALQLLGDELKDNGALLRAALAAKQTGRQALADKWSKKLRDRFTETRLRGDLPHGRYEARFELEFGADPQKALDLAVANWDRQKEARDTRNVLEAALAAENAAAAEPVLAFLKQHGTQDVALDELVMRLEVK